MPYIIHTYFAGVCGFVFFFFIIANCHEYTELMNSTLLSVSVCFHPFSTFECQSMHRKNTPFTRLKKKTEEKNEKSIEERKQTEKNEEEEEKNKLQASPKQTVTPLPPEIASNILFYILFPCFIQWIHNANARQWNETGKVPSTKATKKTLLMLFDLLLLLLSCTRFYTKRKICHVNSMAVFR